METAKSKPRFWARCLVAQRDGLPEGGFTLIELLIVVVLIPLVIGAVAVALITVLKDQSGVQNRLSDSHDAQLTATYLVRDVQGATQFETSATPLCIGPDLPYTTFTQVLGLEFASTVSVSYVYESGGTASPIFVRWYCSGATVSRSVVAHGLTRVPTVCVNTSNGSVQNCITSSTPESLSAAGVQEITFTVPDTSSGFSYNQLAAPRLAKSTVSPITGGPQPMKFSLILLGGGQTCPILTIKNVAHLNTGATGGQSIAINSNCSNPIFQKNNSKLMTTSIQTQANPPLTQSCNNCTPASYPATFNPDPVPDPYASLAAPAKPAAGTCVTTGSNVVCTAGYYNSSNCPTFATSGVSVTFAPGTSYFDGCSLFLQSNGQTANNITLTAINVLFYFTNGASMQVGNNPSLSITAATTGPGCLSSPSAYYMTYPCVALWQDSTDTTAWTWGGGTQKGTISIAGTDASPGGVQGSAIFMPTASLAISNVQTLTITQAVLQSLTIDNVGTTEIG